MARLGAGQLPSTKNAESRSWGSAVPSSVDARSQVTVESLTNSNQTTASSPETIAVGTSAAPALAS